MAKICPETGSLILQIVYDGLPFSGKTTSLKKLASTLKSEAKVETPEQASERTVYFDWFEYHGGLFKGKKMRCQLLTVPGQDDLAQRRKYILQHADAVIFVVDSSPLHIESSQARFLDLQTLLAEQCQQFELAPVKTIIQANKTDLPNALAPDALKELFNQNVFSITQSNALSGVGIRECFTMAVHIGAARAQTLLSNDIDIVGTPYFSDSSDLKNQIDELETQLAHKAPLTPTESTGTEPTQAPQQTPASQTDNPPPATFSLFSPSDVLRSWPKLAAEQLGEIFSQPSESHELDSFCIIKLGADWLLRLERQATFDSLNDAESAYKAIIRRGYSAAGIMTLGRFVLLVKKPESNSFHIVQIRKHCADIQMFFNKLAILGHDSIFVDKAFPIVYRIIKQGASLCSGLNINQFQLSQVTIQNGQLLWNDFIDTHIHQTEIDVDEMVVSQSVFKQIKTLFDDHNGGVAWENIRNGLIRKLTTTLPNRNLIERLNSI